MFRQIRYQTGELDDVINEMKKSMIPCMDVDDYDEMEWVVDRLSEKGVYRVEGLPYDKNARDRIKEPEFEFRIGFYSRPVTSKDVQIKDLMFIDFYFEPDIDKTYDPIFGD